MKGKPVEPNQAELSKATLYGQCQFSPQEATILLEVGEFTEGPLFAAFVRERLAAQVAVRSAIVNRAQEGDAPAQKQFFTLAEKSEFDIE